MNKVSKPKNFFKTFKRLLKYFGKKKYRLILVIFLVIYTSFANIYGTYLLGTIIDGAIKNKDSTELLYSTLTLLGIFIPGVICDLSYTQIMVKLSQDVLYNLRADLSRHTQDLPLTYFDKHSHGEIMTYFTNDVDTLINALNDSFANIILSVCNIIGTIVMLLCINIYLTFIVLGFMVLISTFIYWNTKKCRKYFVNQQNAVSKINAKVEEDILGVKTIKAFNHEDDSFEDFDKVNKAWLKESTSSFFHTQLNVPVIVTFSYLEFAVACIVGIVFLVNGWIPGIGALTSYVVSVRQSVQPFNFFSQHLNTILTALAGSERIFDYLDEKEEEDFGKVTLIKTNENSSQYSDRYSWCIPLENGEKKIVPLKGEIVFKDVYFGYSPDKLILKGISFYAKPGQKIAFVGSTGAGKTTIISLINRFYNIHKGEIFYDGINIKDIKLESLRRSISMVTQDTHLFTGTIYDNIRYSRLHSTNEEIIEASKIANCDRFIRMLPDGYNTILTDDGHNLSEGQRQLIALARAALSMPPLLILDEATSNIDTRSEKLVQKSMDKLMIGRTVLVIAHRLSTVRNSEAILYLENGKIIERGSNDDLLKLKGKYYALYNGQTELE